MRQILIKDSNNLKHSKNVKSVTNTSVSNLVTRCREIRGQLPWRGEKKRRSEKHMLLEI